MGETIALTVGPHKTRRDLLIDADVVYLCPHGAGRWLLLDGFYRDGRSRAPGIRTGHPFPDLEAAVYAAYDYLVQVEHGPPDERDRSTGADGLADEKRHCALFAGAMVSGALDLIDGCLELVAALRAVGLARDPDALRLEGFCADADRFPRGAARARWHADALADSDAERARHIESWRSEIVDACSSLQRRLSA
jgi:hypothetical protein